MQTTRGQRMTSDFIWSETEFLGAGGMGNVYRGTSKLTPTSGSVAIKTFEVGLKRSAAKERRELEILKAIKHPNIVEVIAIQDELFPGSGGPNGKQAIIMEYADGGNLENVLVNDPEFRLGLPESEFLIVWEHLTNAMFYLREHGISHCDLKPANILIFRRTGAGGANTYKITDFDRARYLEDGETFPSLAGTLGYIHPEMFARTYLSKDTTCDTSVDLWSIGSTLFHCATGKYPFIDCTKLPSLNGTYEALKSKPMGSIRAEMNPPMWTEMDPSGKIYFSNRFPVSCGLSKGLKKLLAPILGNLFEWDYKEKKSIWGYKDYFDASYAVLGRRRVNVFNFNGVGPEVIYLEAGTDAGANAAGTGIVILNLHGTIHKNLDAAPTTPENPLLVFSTNPNLTTPGVPNVKRHFRTSSTQNYQEFPNVPNLKSDNEISRYNMDFATLKYRDLEWFDNSLRWIDLAVQSLHQMILNQLTEYERKEESWMVQLGVLEQSLGLIQNLKGVSEQLGTGSNSQLSQEIEATSQEYLQKIQELKEYILDVKKSIGKLLADRSGSRNIVTEWESSKRQVPDFSRTKNLKEGLEKQFLAKRSFEIIRLENPNYPSPVSTSVSLSQKEKDYSRPIERRLLMTYCARLGSIHQQFKTFFDKTVSELGIWYESIALPSIQSIMFLEGLLAELETKLKILTQEIPEIVTSLRNKFKTELESQLASIQVPIRKQNRDKLAKEKLKNGLAHAAQLDQEVRGILEEQGQLVEIMKSLMNPVGVGDKGREN